MTAVMRSAEMPPYIAAAEIRTHDTNLETERRALHQPPENHQRNKRNDDATVQLDRPIEESAKAAVSATL